MLELAKLYATITYFHPTASTAWAEATEKYFPIVLKQPTQGTLGAWLATLSDSATALIAPDMPEPVATPGYVSTTSDGWPLLTLPDVGWLLTNPGTAALAGFIARATRVPGVILDLQASAPVTQRAVERWEVLTSGIASPTLIQRAHYGKVPEVESATGNFRTGWVERDAAQTLTRWPRTAILCTQHTPLPSFVLALAQLGRATFFLVGEGEPTLWAPTVTLPLPGGRKVRVRTGTTQSPEWTRTTDPLTEARKWLTNSTVLPKPVPYRVQGSHTLTVPHTRLHAALRLWSAIWLLHPDRVALQTRWEQAWPGFLAQVLAATDAPRFHRAVRRLLTLTHDGHALTVTPLDGLLFGSCEASVRLQTIEGKPTIVAVQHPAAAAGGASVGAVIVGIDGLSVAQRRARLEPYLATGTPQAREHYLNNRLLAGDEGSMVALRLESGASASVPRLPSSGKERVGEIVRTLAGGVVYADLERLTLPDVVPFFSRFQSAPALILDLRGYVEELAWALVPYIAKDDRAIAVRFVRPVALPPEDGELTGRRLEEVFEQHLPSRHGQRRYLGKVAVLIDERTQSQAEHTALFLRACGALLVGSPTAGAVGDVTNLALTDGIIVRFSGQEVRLPDGTRVAGVGIVPPLRVRPTRRGLQAGRDEVLEAALKALTSRG